MSKLSSSRSRQRCRPSAVWLLAVLSLGNSLSSATPENGAAAAQAAPSPPPNSGAPAAPAAPGTPAVSSPAAPAAAGTVGTAPTPPPANASRVPAGAVGGLAPSDRIAVDVWALNPEAQELHLDIRDNVLNLTLDQAVEIALRRNLTLILQRYIRNEARLGIDQALGIYDLNLTGLGAYTKTKTAPTTIGTAASQTQSEWRAGLAQLFPSGGTLNFVWDNLKTSQPGASSFFLFPGGVYQPNTAFSFTQPLLKGFGSAVTDQPILLAQNTSEINRAQFELQIITVSQQVINDYWNLVNAREQLVVAQESLQLARDLNERNRIQVQVGTLAPLEIVQSQAAIATREQGIITAQQVIGDAADQLRLALNLPPGDLWQIEILPTTPPESDTLRIDLKESIETGLGNRVETRTENLNVDRAKLVDRVAKNSLLPTLNLIANYSLGGANSSYTAALQQITRFDFPGWTIGLSFAFPIQNRAARAAKAIADLDVNRFQWELDQQRKIIINEVRRAVRGIETAEKVIVAAHASRDFQEKNLDAEHKRYENGMSTSFQITQIQDQLTLAKQSEVNAVVGYRTALAEYYRSIGKLMPELGVHIVDPKESINRFTFRRLDLIP